MKVVIAGGSGFIGNKLTQYLLKKGHQVVILSRNPQESNGEITYVKWLTPDSKPELELKAADAVINLAGVSINDGRWTKEHQKKIYGSRMTATDELLKIISQMAVKPNVWINASAIGIYPASETAVYTEASKEIANDFLGKTVHDWEKKADEVTALGIRSVYMRFGVVLGKEGGALPLMALPYKLYCGGRVGSGKQWVSWIHVMDVVRAIVFAIVSNGIKGPVNVSAPVPVRMNEFGQTLGGVSRRPHWLPVHEFAMKLVLGKKSTLVLEGQQVVPNVLLHSGFEFTYPTLTTALEDLLTGGKMEK